MPDAAVPPPEPLAGRHSLQRRAVLLALFGVLLPVAILAELGRRSLDDVSQRIVRERQELARAVAVAVEITVSGPDFPDVALKEARAGLLLRAFREDRSLAVELLDETGCAFATSNALPESPDDVVAAAPVPSTGWRVRVRQTHGEAFAEVIVLERWLLFLTPLFLAVAGVFAWGAARSVRRPLRALTESADRLAAGDLSRPVAVPKGGK